MSLRTVAMQSCSIMSLRAVRRSNPADLRKSAYALADLPLFIVGFHPTYNSDSESNKEVLESLLSSATDKEINAITDIVKTVLSIK